MLRSAEVIDAWKIQKLRLACDGDFLRSISLFFIDSDHLCSKS